VFVLINIGSCKKQTVACSAQLLVFLFIYFQFLLSELRTCKSYFIN